MDSQFGKRLAHARAAKNMTQRELADVIGINWSQVSRYEAGKAKPRLAVLLKLAEALDTTPESLTGSDDDEAGREITLDLSTEASEQIESIAEKEGITFDQAVQKVIAMGLKMKLDQNPDMLSQLEEDVPGAYEKLLKLLSKVDKD